MLKKDINSFEWLFRIISATIWRLKYYLLLTKTSYSFICFRICRTSFCTCRININDFKILCVMFVWSTSEVSFNDEFIYSIFGSYSNAVYKQNFEITKCEINFKQLNICTYQYTVQLSFISYTGHCTASSTYFILLSLKCMCTVLHQKFSYSWKGILQKCEYLYS